MLVFPGKTAEENRGVISLIGCKGPFLGSPEMLAFLFLDSQLFLQPRPFAAQFFLDLALFIFQPD